jgi:FkbM family methyltransferase
VPSLGNGIARPIDAERVIALLESVRASDLPDPGSDFLVDWSGIRTRVGMLPWAPTELIGTVSRELPIPDDGYRSEDVEYAALAQAIDTAEGTFRVVEVGAGWAPWAVSGIVYARRRGLTAQAVAVEADPTRADWAMQHAVDNDVSARLLTGTPEEIAEALAGAADDVELQVVLAAGWHTTTTLQFPDLDESDMGAAVWTLPGTDVDYRGAHLSHHDVPAVSLTSLLEGHVRTDFLHVDVQGVEFDLLDPMSDVIQRNVRLMMVGTTDRLAEGRLQQHFLSRGWGLLIDQPCTANFLMTHPTLSGFTVQDGNQLWENPFLRT